MSNTDRIPEYVLTNGFKDGDDWDAATLNKIVAVLIAGINANYASLNNTEFVPNPSLEIFLEQTYNPDKAEITQQLDGKITSYFTDNDPNTWDATERAKHGGDMWYLPTYNMLKRYNATENRWDPINDATAIAAYEVASHAQDTADGKRRIFTEMPSPPYDIGDLWVDLLTQDIKVCIQEKLEGDFSKLDWRMASDYIKDPALENVIIRGVQKVNNSNVIINEAKAQIGTGDTYIDINDKGELACRYFGYDALNVNYSGVDIENLRARGADIANLRFIKKGYGPVTKQLIYFIKEVD